MVFQKLRLPLVINSAPWLGAAPVLEYLLSNLKAGIPETCPPELEGRDSRNMSTHRLRTYSDQGRDHVAFPAKKSFHTVATNLRSMPAERFALVSSKTSSIS